MAMNATMEGQRQPTRRLIQVSVARETLMRIAPLLVAGERLALDDLLHDIEQEEMARLEAAATAEQEPAPASAGGDERRAPIAPESGQPTAWEPR